MELSMHQDQRWDTNHDVIVEWIGTYIILSDRAYMSQDVHVIHNNWSTLSSCTLWHILIDQLYQLPANWRQSKFS